MYYAKIETFTHFFAVYPHTLQLRNLIYKFAFDFVEYEWKYNNRDFKGDQFQHFIKNAVQTEKELEHWKQNQQNR